jgi:hypothetical protein
VNASQCAPLADGVDADPLAGGPLSATITLPPTSTTAPRVAPAKAKTG